MSGVDVSPVSSNADLKEFIDLPWQIYAGDKKWAPPLKREVRRLLDTRRHPFWRFSQQALFLAYRGSTVVGRIAGIIDGNHNEYHKEKAAAWGFFECRDDPDAAAALFSAVERWAGDQGMTFLRGPLNPSTNYECGLLVEGFEHPPRIMLPYNPPYYASLIESCGFRKEKDLLTFLKDLLSLVVDTHPDRASDRLERLANRVKRKTNVQIRQGRKKDFEAEMALIGDIYLSAWSENWGFVPMTAEEMQEAGKNLVRILDEELVVFFYHGDEPAAVVMMIPDINPLLRLFNGKIGLRGLYHMLFSKNGINGVRGALFGVKKPYQKLGFPVVVFDQMVKVLRGRPEYRYLEFGWTLEDNASINQFVVETGGKFHNRYRIYRKPIVSTSEPVEASVLPRRQFA
ncbi:MAG: acyl-CoA N-acyltransferase [Desulfomonile tiedjei]|nr:acyl-CoA N-acyltransferase [Desulfomonile tiedjei]